MRSVSPGSKISEIPLVAAEGCTGMTMALVHDYLLVLRGAERTFAAMADIWPDAPIYTLLYDEAGTQGRFANRDVRPSSLQRLPLDQSSFRALLPVFPSAARRLPLQNYDVIVSSSSAFAHGVLPGPEARHVCYCHSPFRYAWHEHRRALDEVPGWVRPGLAIALRRHRHFDREAAKQVTGFIANSQITRARIRRYWGRDALVVHPPVDVERFRAIADPDDFVLWVGEVVSHKRPELALEAAQRAGQRVKVVGTGPELARLQARFSNAEFLGRVDDQHLADLYARAKALVVSNIEEFGIAAVEAQAAGCPVIAADGGGARETVISGETGWLVDADDARALAEAMRRDTSSLCDRQTRQEHARRFSPEAFQARMVAAVTEVLESTPSRGSRDATPIGEGRLG